MVQGAGWIPVTGDWNGDGVDMIGLYNPATSTFYLRNTNSSDVADLTFVYGFSGGKPLSGRWVSQAPGSVVPRDGLASVSYDQTTNRINTSGWDYDAAGNQTRVQRADGSWQRHVYDAAGRLVKVQDNASQTQIIYTYGASNHRLIERLQYSAADRH
jgi:YD repeat-containing protein